MITLPCNHAYHALCFNQWILSQRSPTKTCALCRHFVPEAYVAMVQQQQPPVPRPAPSPRAIPSFAGIGPLGNVRSRTPSIYNYAPSSNGSSSEVPVTHDRRPIVDTDIPHINSIPRYSRFNMDTAVENMPGPAIFHHSQTRHERRAALLPDIHHLTKLQIRLHGVTNALLVVIIITLLVMWWWM